MTDNFKENMLPIITALVTNLVRVAGVALVAKGVVNQDVIDHTATGLVQILVGGVVYTISKIWSDKQTKKAVQVETTKQVDQVYSVVSHALNQVPVQVEAQVKEQVPAEVAKSK